MPIHFWFFLFLELNVLLKLIYDEQLVKPVTSLPFTYHSSSCKNLDLDQQPEVVDTATAAAAVLALKHIF